MTTQINGNYLEIYAQSYAELICDQFFKNRQFITGQEIIQLTPSTQVNFFIIKRLFELWQVELSKLKSSPYFDYRDIAVHEALTQFMNVLSRRIKVERGHLEGMLQVAVKDAVLVAIDPVTFFYSELEKAPSGKINEYLKENKKYFKWNEKLVTSLIDKAGIVQELDQYKEAVTANFKVLEDSLPDPEELLTTLSATLNFDFQAVLGKESHPIELAEDVFEDEVPNEVLESEATHEDFTADPILEVEVGSANQEFTEEEAHPVPKANAISTGRGLDSEQLKALFATESYKGMKGILGELVESLAINQRFMFTKELFDGNADLLRHALKAIDTLSTFDEAAERINSRFVFELDWDIDSEEVREFMQQVYRKFVR